MHYSQHEYDTLVLPRCAVASNLSIMKRLIILAAVMTTLASCEEAPLGPVGVAPPSMIGDQTLPPAAPFNPGDFAWSTAQGPDSVTGILAYRRDGSQYNCTGEDVLLIPDTPWSRRRMIILYGSANAAAVPVSIVRARTASAPPGDYARFVRRTRCDVQGRFVFQGLPDGGWYVVTVARPQDPAGEPMAIIRRVELHGMSRSITLS